MGKNCSDPLIKTQKGLELHSGTWSDFNNNAVESVVSLIPNSGNTLGGEVCRGDHYRTVLFSDELPRHSNITVDKMLNLFNKCATRYLHLSSWEEECASSSWGDIKMYTSRSITNLQRKLTEISWCYYRVKILVEQVILQDT